MAVDVLCFNTAQNALGQDDLIQIPNTDLVPTPSLVVPNPIKTPVSAMTPVRDVSGIYLNLFLAQSVVPGNSYNCIGCTPGVSGPPYVAYYTGNSPTNSSGLLFLGNSDAYGDQGAYHIGLASQLNQSGCTNCDIDLGFSRIELSFVGSFNSTTYLASSFATGYYSLGAGSQSLWFLEQFTNTGRPNGTAVVLEQGGSSNTWWAYPTFAFDSDVDLYFAYTEFSSSMFPTTFWKFYRAADSIPGSINYSAGGMLEASTVEYTGQSFTPSQRWGDYNAMVYDHMLPSPSGEGAFWQVEEISCSSLPGLPCSGTADESTVWNALADPTPYFIGYNFPTNLEGTLSNGETECGVSGTCGLKFSPPSNSQNGDVFIALFATGGAHPDSYWTLPSGWELLPLANPSNGFTYALRASGQTSWVAVHAYSSSDTVPYKFTYNSTLGPESAGFLVSYRNASTAFPGNYVLYGYGDSYYGNFGTLFAPQITSLAGDSTLLDLFGADCSGTDENAESSYFTAPAPTVVGSPQLTPETPLTSSNYPLLAADVAVPAASVAYGGYITTECQMSSDFVYHLFIPE